MSEHEEITKKYKKNNIVEMLTWNIYAAHQPEETSMPRIYEILI